MPAFVDDEMLDTYAVIGTYDEIAGKLRATASPACATHLEFAIPVAGDADKSGAAAACSPSLRAG